MSKTMSMKSTLPAVFLSIGLLVFSGCTKNSTDSGKSAAEAGDGSRVVNLAIWSNFVKPELLKEFEKRTGIKVQVSNYSSNEELLAKLQAGASGYDVVVPSDYMVFAMIKLGLLKELDFSKLPHSKLVDPTYLKKHYDPTNKFSVPYDIGTTGIAVNRTLFKGKISGWKDFFNTPELAGKVTLLDDVRETLGAALKAQGFSLNSQDAGQLAKAKELLLKMRPRVKAFTSEPMMPLVNGETAVAHAFSADALQARRQTAGKVEYLIPEEGGTFSIDSLVIPMGAQHVQNAHALIDFLLEPQSVVQTALTVMVAPPSKEAVALMPAALQADPVLFPRGSILQKLEMIEDLGEGLAVWDRIWTEVKAKSE